MNNLFQVTQTLRSLRELVTVTVTPYMRIYATHIAIAYTIAIVGWLLYSHQTNTTTMIIIQQQLMRKFAN